jgi:hypothetical protein
MGEVADLVSESGALEKKEGRRSWDGGLRGTTSIAVRFWGLVRRTQKNYLIFIRGVMEGITSGFINGFTLPSFLPFFTGFGFAMVLISLVSRKILFVSQCDDLDCN